LLKESGYEDEFFDNIFNFLIGYSENIEVDISEKSLLLSNRFKLKSWGMSSNLFV